VFHQLVLVATATQSQQGQAHMVSLITPLGCQKAARNRCSQHVDCILWQVQKAAPQWMSVSRMIFYHHPNIIATHHVAIALLYIKQNVYGLLWVHGTI